jgi:thiol-disulfide isomerase/thioredoxin
MAGKAIGTLASILTLALVVAASEVVQREIIEAKSARHLKKTLQNNVNSFIVVLFYSPFCPACKKFHPIYKKASGNLPEASKELKFVQVNAYSHPAVIPKYRVAMLPTLLIYDGQRLADTLDSQMSSQEFLVFNWIKKNTGMPGALSFFAQQSRKTFDNLNGEEGELADSGHLEQTRILEHESRLAQRLFEETYQDNSLEEKAKELMDGTGLLV